MSRGDKRQRIMQAAEKLFTSRRFHEITLDDVAREAHVGKGTIYLYFRDKDDLFLQTATGGFEELCQLLHARVPGDALFPEQLTLACHEISGFFQKRRQLLRLMQTEEGRVAWCHGALYDRWFEKRKMLVTAVTAILAKGVAESALRSDIPPEVLAQFLLGMLRTRGRDLAEMPEDERRLELVVDLFCNGARKESL